MSIALSANVQKTVNAIDEDELNPVVDPGDGFIYVLNTSNKELGNLIYTVFNAETRFPDASFQVRYGTYHIVAQALWDPMPRSRLEKIADLEIPGMPPDNTLFAGLPRVLPGWAPTLPTEINQEKG